MSSSPVVPASVITEARTAMETLFQNINRVASEAQRAAGLAACNVAVSAEPDPGGMKRSAPSDA
eukprot:10403380-Karenia_brevis.AAC.1